MTNFTSQEKLSTKKFHEKYVEGVLSRYELVTEDDFGDDEDDEDEDEEMHYDDKEEEEEQEEWELAAHGVQEGMAVDEVQENSGDSEDEECAKKCWWS